LDVLVVLNVLNVLRLEQVMSISKSSWMVVAGVTLVLAGCADDEVVVASAPQAQMASVRVVHLSPDAPSVDIYANGADRVVADLAFGEESGVLDVPAGSYDFNVAPAGTSVDASVLDINGIALDMGKSYTAAAFGEVANITAIAIEDDFEDIADGNIRVRAIHAADGVGQVDIWNITDPANPSPMYTDVDFGAAGDAIDVPAAAYTIGFDVDDDAVPDVTFDLPSLPAGESANIFAVNDGGVALVAQLKDGTMARIEAN
jgi:hypothetical protein